MSFDKIIVPEGGKKITATNGVLNVPDNPILMFIEGDGIGYDIMTASKRIWDAAIEKAYGGNRKVAWMEIYSGEKAASVYDGNYMPEETFEALREFKVGIKGPLTTPVGGGFRSLNVTLRQVLDLYSCIRPVRWYNGVPSPLKNPEDVDVVELHDCFTSNEIITYEALQLTEEGGSEQFVSDGDNTYGGKVVVNPSGGLLSKGHPLGATGLGQCAELVWQLRGEAGPRQVEGARVGLQHNLGLGGACVVSLYQKM